jgi:hypothetical protein
MVCGTVYFRIATRVVPARPALSTVEQNGTRAENFIIFSIT